MTCNLHGAQGYVFLQIAIANETVNGVVDEVAAQHGLLVHTANGHAYGHAYALAQRTRSGFYAWGKVVFGVTRR